mgnify:CR=1 FL=1
MRGGKGAKIKGSTREREVVHIFQEAGIAAQRVPNSGSSGLDFAGDVNVPILGRDHRIEVKAKASGFKSIYSWLGDHYGLVIRADRSEPLMVVRLKDFAELAIKADQHR